MDLVIKTASGGLFYFILFSLQVLLNKPPSCCVLLSSEEISKHREKNEIYPEISSVTSCGPRDGLLVRQEFQAFPRSYRKDLSCPG